jgi:molybdate transport system ATP-binding protein
LGQAVALLGISHLLARRPDTLSGGERQRVGIARALLTSPRILLMDEPLAALDAKRKAEILPYLEKLHDQLDIPVIYVSHSPEEVARLADHLVLLDQGRVVASGSLVETLGRLDLPGAFLDSAGVVISAMVAEHDDKDHLSRIAFAGGQLWVNRRDVPVGHAVRCRIDSRDVSLALSQATDSSIVNVIAAVITDWVDTDHPARVLVRLDAQGTILFARITQRSLKALDLHLGQTVWAQIKAVALLND